MDVRCAKGLEADGGWRDKVDPYVRIAFGDTTLETESKEDETEPTFNQRSVTTLIRADLEGGV